MKTFARVVTGLCGVSISLALLMGPARAETFTVNRLDDTDARDCAGAAGGCTLRGAINLAEQTVEPDVINIAVKGTVSLASSLPQINHSLVIKGGNPQEFTVDGNDIPGVRPFTVRSQAEIVVSLIGLTVTRGNANDAGGGGIQAFGPVALHLEKVHVVANTTTDEMRPENVIGCSGGGIFSQRANLTITDSVIKENRSVTSRKSFGGGLRMVAGTLNMKGCQVTGNSLAKPGEGFGAGIYVMHLTSGVIEDSTIGGNSAVEGAGLFAMRSSLRIINCVINDNVSNKTGGGAAFTGGTALLDRVTISGNKADMGGGIMAVGGASVTLANCSVNGNTGRDGADIKSLGATIR